MLPLCFLAVFAAVAGLAVVGFALGTAAASVVLLAAPVLGLVSLTSGLAAAVLAMRRKSVFA
jgi:hypothetical protein